MDILANTNNQKDIEKAAFSCGPIQEPPYAIAPRVWSAKQIAARLNHSVGWFYAHMPYLRQLGFPKKDGVLGGWDSRAVETWLDNRAGINSVSSVEDQMLEAIRGNC